MKSKTERVEASAWAKRIKEYCPTTYYLNKDGVVVLDDDSCYKRAIELASEKEVLVDVILTNENGVLEWAIVSVSERGFWFDVKSTQRSALSLCKKMGWKVVTKSNQTI